MKVAMLIHPITIVDPQRCGGVERVALNELEHLTKNGIYAKLYVRGYVGTHPYIETIKNFRYGEDFGREYYVWFIERSKSADILHGMNTPLLSIISNKPRVLVHMHNSVTLPYYKIAHKKYKNCFFAFCSLFLLKDFLTKHPDFPQDKCFLLYNGVDTNRFAPDHKCEKEKLRVLYAGSWSRPKGVFVFLEAARLLEGWRHDFEVVIAGSPYLYNTGCSLEWQVDAERRVKESVGKLKCARIIGSIEFERMPQLYQSSDIFVFPSVWEEPFGLCTIEAMSSAKPVIASHVGGIPEVVKDGKTGLLVKHGDPKELANAIEYLLDNEEQRRNFGAEGRKRVQKLFSLETHIRKLIGIYEKMEGFNQ